MCTQLWVLVYCWHSYRLSCFASSSLGNRSTIRYGLAVSKYEMRVSFNHCHHASNKDRWHNNSENKHFTKDNKASTRWQSKPHTRAWENTRGAFTWHSFWVRHSHVPKLEVFSSPESLRSWLCHESEGSGVENELWDAKVLYFPREERWPRRIGRIVAQFASGATMPETC